MLVFSFLCHKYKQQHSYDATALHGYLLAIKQYFFMSVNIEEWRSFFSPMNAWKVVQIETSRTLYFRKIIFIEEMKIGIDHKFWIFKEFSCLIHFITVTIKWGSIHSSNEEIFPTSHPSIQGWIIKMSPSSLLNSSWRILQIIFLIPQNTPRTLLNLFKSICNQLFSLCFLCELWVYSAESKVSDSFAEQAGAATDTGVSF